MKIVCIGGGTGLFTLLKGLKNYDCKITAIVTMADNGGSSGQLRDEMGVLPPGDVRRCLVALSDNKELLADLFEYRFDGKGSLNGHSFGNLFLSALTKVTGNMERAIRESSNILAVKGKVVPVTTQECNLYAELDNGEIIKGETNIDIPKHNIKNKIKKVFLSPANIYASPSAIDAISEANVIIIGPGDLYTSIIPNLLVRDIPNAIFRSSAKKILIGNLMTKRGETDNFKASDFLNVIEKYLGKDIINYYILNDKIPEKKLLEKYEKENSIPILIDEENKKTKIIKADLMNPTDLIRHDSIKLSKIIIEKIKD